MSTQATSWCATSHPFGCDIPVALVTRFFIKSIIVHTELQEEGRYDHAMLRWQLVVLGAIHLVVLFPRNSAAFVGSSSFLNFRPRQARVMGEVSTSAMLFRSSSSIRIPSSAVLRLSSNKGDEEGKEGLGKAAKKGLTFGLENAFSIMDAVIWASISVSVLLYVLGYTFDIDKDNGFQVRIETIEQVRTEKQFQQSAQH